MTKFSLDTNLIPFLKKKGKNLTAKATVAGSKLVIELDKGVSVTVATADTGLKFGKSLDAELTFDEEGGLLFYELGAEPTQRAPAQRSGAPSRLFEQR